MCRQPLLPTIDPLVAAQGGCSSSADDVIAAECVSSRKRSPTAVAHRLLPDLLILVRDVISGHFLQESVRFPKRLCLCFSKTKTYILPSYSIILMKYKQKDWIETTWFSKMQIVLNKLANQFSDGHIWCFTVQKNGHWICLPSAGWTQSKRKKISFWIVAASVSLKTFVYSEAGIKDGNRALASMCCCGVCLRCRFQREKAKVSSWVSLTWIICRTPA